MAVLMMDHDNNNSSTNEEDLMFHDFLGKSRASDSPVVVVAKSVGIGADIRFSEASASVGASSGGHGPVSTISDLGSGPSEGQAGIHFEGVPLYGPKSDFSGHDISIRFPGRKRSNSDSAYIGLTRERMPQVGPDSLESSHLMKILRNGMGGERPRRSCDEELFTGMQPPRPTSNSPLILQPPIASRPDSTVSKWERSVPMNAGPIVQYPPCLGQFAPFLDKASSNRDRDANAGPSLISQSAADEGSRTGVKGSGLLSSINASSGIPERNSSGVLPSSSRLNYGTHNTESTNPPSQHVLISTSRQMTIFYAGQAHVFDDVLPNKADVIMALAGSNGGSWSTTYSPKSTVRPPLSEAYRHNGGNETGKCDLAPPQESHGRLSFIGNSSRGFSQGGQISTTLGYSLNLSSGDHQGGTTVRAQELEPSTEGKTEL